MIVQHVPEPHPLDFDWRFTAETACMLWHRVCGSSLLAVGTPVLAQLPSTQLCTVQLVDRQPHISPFGGAILDVEVAAAIEGRWTTAILDPPWYPVAHRRWLGWAAQHVPVGGTILASLWPIDTRPTAQLERDELLVWASSWAEHHVEPATLRYEVPLFESVARKLQGVPDFAKPWRTGDLLELVVRRTPSMPPALLKTEVWRRFVWGDYQLALRVTGDDTDQPALTKHPLAQGWLWPSYSRRAEGRDRIDLWSSRNEVAIVTGARRLDEELSRFTAGEPLTEHGGETVRQILGNWQAPVHPFHRSYSWTHHE